jgi:hypothetical protein
MNLTYKEAWENVGGLSVPSKMPCYGWSISAKLCKIGSKLHEIPGSVCSGCYALRGNYMFPCVQNAMKRRLEKFYSKEFIPSLIYLLQSLDQKHFRWFDSGDLQDSEMFNRIVEIAVLCPDIKFWLPTKEYKIVSHYIERGFKIPSNLTIRLSGYMINESGPVSLAKKLHVNISEVRQDNFTCPASKQDNFCGTCRKCWDKKEFNVIYKKH